MSGISCILVAAGRGTRAGLDTPKQYTKIGGIPVMTRSIQALLQNQSISELICVIHAEDQERYQNAINGIDDARLKDPALGGVTRSASCLLYTSDAADD